MAQNEGQQAQIELVQARSRGHSEGLALAALSLSLISFLNLLGVEKSILAIIFAVAALAGTRDEPGRRRAFIALGLSALHIATIAVVLVVFHEQLGELLKLLSKLG